jgi:hypothetical protein
MKTPAKRIVKVEMGTLDVNYVSAESVMETLQAYLKEYGAGNVDLRMDNVPYEDREACYIMVAREETDDEYAVRLAQVKSQKEAADAHERAEFERLAKKFGVKK